ncbi:MAG: helix-turn-helix transcriptional regulator [Clostridia bacterium]|nr:helix-turn-helix transcriptional regulator [Clostridia bacterium]
MKKAVTDKNQERYRKIGKRIAELRKEQSFTQRELSEKAGISMTTLREIENPKICRNFSLDFIFFISDALNIEPEKLL